MNIHNIIIDFFAYKMMNDVNVFDVSIKLSVLCESDCALIVLKDHDDLKIRIVKSQKLIKKVLQSNNFLNNLRLIDILCLTNEQYHNDLTFT